MTEYPCKNGMRTRSIMIQGTMSGVGKSFLTAGLCRIFKQDGYRVAPFKSQNMALNSCVTADGLEIGRAQAMQAEACGVEPSVLMNPILLKPVSNIGSQVIVNGEVMGNMSASEYFRARKSLVPGIMRAFNSLSARYDIIVIEGAGSPAELNLKADDIVNMGLAEMTKSPVLLVGNIDPGGIFAQLIGTLSLLEAWERKYIKALIVNRFRGDIGLFASGVKILEEKGGRPVAGVIPFLPVDLEEEDSLSARFSQGKASRIDIACVRLPRISNYTDLMALEATEDVGVRYAERVQDLGNPDMLVLPGTKNTISDLLWLRESGMEAAIQKLASSGTVIFGLCGGYQMLGKAIADPAGVEGGGKVVGLGLLSVETVFRSEKIRRNTIGCVTQCGGALSGLSGCNVEGYEIHMGDTRLCDGASPLLTKEDGELEGAWAGNVYGTYLHGFFDSGSLRKALVKSLCVRKGISGPEGELQDLRIYKEKQYDLLAESLRENLNMELVYQIVNEGV